MLVIAAGEAKKADFWALLASQLSSPMRGPVSERMSPEGLHPRLASGLCTQSRQKRQEPELLMPKLVSVAAEVWMLTVA